MVVTLKNVTQNVITYIVKAICASHSLTQSDTLDSDVVDRGLDTTSTNTNQLSLQQM